MAGGDSVVKKVMRFKLQLSDTSEPATILKILQKLKKLDITLDILAETGIGKTVNSLRRHEQAGGIAKSMVTCWKQLMSKGSTRNDDDGDLSEKVSAKDKPEDQISPDHESLAMQDETKNCLAYDYKKQDSSEESSFETRKRKADSDKEQCGERKELKVSRNNNSERHKQGNNKISEDISRKRREIKENKTDNSAVSKKRKKNKKKKSHNDKKIEDDDDSLGNEGSDDTCPRRSSLDSKEKVKGTLANGKHRSERESKLSKGSSREDEESFAFEFTEKSSITFKVPKDVRDDGSRKAEVPRQKRDKADEEKHANQKDKSEPDDRGYTKHKKAKNKHRSKKSNIDEEEPSMSFESYLSYDENARRVKDRPAVKKTHKTIKKAVKEQPNKEPGLKPIKSTVTSPKQLFKDSVKDLATVPLPATLPECENPFVIDYFEKKVEKEPDFCDLSEESVVFTGQRLNKKMQVYSGAKTPFLPTMISLYQQCVRTLQNNIDLLYETGGVPFEILEPVLERCTPEQLLRIEEFNPIYNGVTDHLWGKHCQREFKGFKLQEYESWKEMYIRLFQERERKLQRLTESIVSANHRKPKGRQVKMVFIHSVAKPPRDVRIQQEIHGTAVQQPHPLRCSSSVKVLESRSRPASYSEPSSSSSSSSSISSSSGGSNTQDPRKKTRVAPMMAKSLKAFKKQLQRR